MGCLMGGPPSKWVDPSCRDGSGSVTHGKNQGGHCSIQGQHLQPIQTGSMGHEAKQQPHSWNTGLNTWPIAERKVSINNPLKTAINPLFSNHSGLKTHPTKLYPSIEHKSGTWCMENQHRPTIEVQATKNTHTHPRTNRGPYTLCVMGPGLVIEGKLLHNFQQKNIKKPFPPLWQHGTPKNMCAIIQWQPQQENQLPWKHAKCQFLNNSNDQL